MIALIDADIIVYRVGFACETKFYDIFTENGIVSFSSAKERNTWLEEHPEYKTALVMEERIQPEPLENCLHSVKLQIQGIKKATKSKEVKLFLTGKNNFRDDIVDYYKANRKDARKPYHYQAIRDYLVKYYDAEVIEGQEADDALGIEQCMTTYAAKQQVLGNHKPTYSCICSIDKDLDMIPGRHYNFVKQEKYFVDEAQAMRFFYYQMLQGDAADNIPGLSKITGTRVRKWDDMLAPIDDMSNEVEMYDYVLDSYIKAFEDVIDIKDDPWPMITAIEDKLKEIGQLLWIRRKEDEVWRPPV